MEHFDKYENYKIPNGKKIQVDINTKQFNGIIH